MAAATQPAEPTLQWSSIVLRPEHAPEQRCGVPAPALLLACVFAVLGVVAETAALRLPDGYFIVTGTPGARALAWLHDAAFAGATGLEGTIEAVQRSASLADALGMAAWSIFVASVCLSLSSWPSLDLGGRAR